MTARLKNFVDKNFMGAPKTTKSMKILGYMVIDIMTIVKFIVTFTYLLSPLAITA